MTHANGSGTDPEVKPASTETTKESPTAEVLKKPEIQQKATLALVKGGLALRARAETPGTRQALCKKLLDAMTPEAQAEFINNTHSWLHMAKEFVLQNIAGGTRSLWKTVAPSLLPEDWITLETFNEDEVKGYIAVGAIDVEENVAKLVDGDLKGKVKVLKTISWLCLLIPEAGVELNEIIGGIAHLAEAPAEFLEKVLPEVRVAVRNGGLVVETMGSGHAAMANSLAPEVDLTTPSANNPVHDVSAAS